MFKITVSCSGGIALTPLYYFFPLNRRWNRALRHWQWWLSVGRPLSLTIRVKQVACGHQVGLQLLQLSQTFCSKLGSDLCNKWLVLNIFHRYAIGSDLNMISLWRSEVTWTEYTYTASFLQLSHIYLYDLELVFHYYWTDVFFGLYAIMPHLIHDQIIGVFKL